MAILLKTFPKFINQFDLQVFTTKNSEGEVRYYFGFPLKLIQTILDQLEQDLYWGEHSFEENGYYMYYTGIISHGDQPAPWQILDMRLKKHFIPQFNAALRAAKKFAGQQYTMQVPKYDVGMKQSVEDVIRQLKQG